jgi:hypothetical protein
LAQLGSKLHNTDYEIPRNFEAAPIREWAANFSSDMAFLMARDFTQLARTHDSHELDRKIEVAEHQDKTEKTEVECCKTLAYVFLSVVEKNDRHLEIYLQNYPSLFPQK